MKTTLITARVTLIAPGGVSAPENVTTTTDDDGTPTRAHLPLRRDPAGHPHIPGTSVAGALKQHCRDIPALHGLFGSDPGNDERTPSTVQVLGCVLPEAVRSESRTRTAVNRHRAAPAQAMLYTVEQLPAGTAIDIVLRCDDIGADRIEALTDALRVWTPRIGRGASTGAGLGTVTHLGRADYDLADPADLMAWLRLADTGGRAYPVPTPITASPSGAVHRFVRFEIVDALHIGTGKPIREGNHDVNPVVCDHDGNPIVPGSTMKGVLRSRAEYICRRCGRPACDPTRASICPLDDPCPPCRIFGRPANRDGDGARRALIAVPDVLIENHKVEQRTHVAIDRFTSGARESLLYTDDVVAAGQFTLRIDLLDGPLHPVDTALLDAVLADIHDGLVGLGARTTAGYGTVHIIDPTWTPPELHRLAEHLAGGTG